jgi:hypothetical protein
MRANCSKLEGVFDLLPDEQERIAVVLDEAYDSTKPSPPLQTTAKTDFMPHLPRALLYARYKQLLHLRGNHAGR